MTGSGFIRSAWLLCVYNELLGGKKGCRDNSCFCNDQVKNDGNKWTNIRNNLEVNKIDLLMNLIKGIRKRKV